MASATNTVVYVCESVRLCVSVCVSVSVCMCVCVCANQFKFMGVSVSLIYYHKTLTHSVKFTEDRRVRTLVDSGVLCLTRPSFSALKRP